MSSIQSVATKVGEVGKLVGDFAVQATGRLIGSTTKKAGELSVEEMSRRLDGALRALRGEEPVVVSAPAVMRMSPPQVAQEMVNSYSFNKETGVSTFTIPAGVTDIEAIKVLNDYFRKSPPGSERGFVYARDLDWYENCPERDCSQAREVTIRAVVKGTNDKDRSSQEEVLKGESLIFSDPRDQAIAAALHACKYNGAGLFQDLWVRGSVPGFALLINGSYGVVVCRSGDDRGDSEVVAAGSPSPESKKLAL